MDLDLLDIQPRELKFLFELKKQSSSFIQLSNNSNQYVAFKVKTTSPKKYCARPNVGIVKPKSACDFTVTMKAQRVAPPDLHCKDKFLILSTVVPFGTIDEDITSDMFSKNSGKYVEERKLRVVFVRPPQSPESPVLLPLSGELRKDLHEESQVQKDQIPDRPPLGGGDMKQDLHYGISVQRESVLTGLSGDVDIKQDPCHDTYIQKHKVTNISLNKEQLNTDESHEELVLEDKVLNGLSEGELYRESSYGGLAVKGGLFSGFGITKELKEDHPCEVLSDENISRKDSSVIGLEMHKKPEKDFASEISLQEEDESLTRVTNLDLKASGLQAALHKEIEHADTEDLTPSTRVVVGAGSPEIVDQEELTATEDIKDPEIVGKDELIPPKDMECDIIDELKAAKHEESSSIDDAKEEKPVKAFAGWDLAKEFKDLNLESSFDEHIELSTVGNMDEPELAKKFSGSDLTKEFEDLKSKLSVADTKLKEAEMTIVKLTDERSMTTREKDMLTRELEVLRRKNTTRKVQVGFPLLYICMVALVSLALGYLSHP